MPDEDTQDSELIRVDPSEFEDGDELNPEDFGDENNDSDEESAKFEEEH